MNNSRSGGVSQSPRYRWPLRRLLRLTVTAAVVEALLLVVRHLAPALAGLLRPMYWLVALGFGVAAWRATQVRHGADRRHHDRREL